MSSFRSLSVRAGGRLAATAALLMLGACRDTTTAAPELTSAFAKAPGSNSIVATVSGLPSGTNARITVTGTGGYSASITSSTTLSGLGNGSYTFSAATVTAGGVSYTPSPASQSVSVSKGSTGRVTITYAAAATTGALNVSISGGVPGAVTVTGPNAYTTSLTASSALTQLAPGSYTIGAANVTSGSIVYAPTPASQVVNVTAGSTASATVAYAATSVLPGSDFNMQILGMYITQSVQTMTQGVTLLADRAGVLRVFAVANQSNTATPTVRVRFFLNSALVSTVTATAAGSAVPTSLQEGTASASWNVAVPASLMQPGLSVVAEVDPDNTVPESSETDNQYPVSGTPQAFTVRAVPTLALTFVPVTQSSTAGTGNVSASNADAFLQSTRDILPVSGVAYSIRAPYTTSQTLLSDGTGWSNVLSELYALRTADKSANNYYGVVKVGYSSGVAGMGYIGAPASMGWDYLSSGSTTLAHELGHNFGRQHAPCGGVAGPDPSYPYAGGIDGVFGYNVRTNTLIPSSTADLMGYCSPRWISDYNYKAMMNFRGFTTSALVAQGVEQDGVLVWGRVLADGSIVLEPSMALNAVPALPQSSGRYQLEGSDAAGNALFQFSFETVAVADDDRGESHFAFVVPMSTAAQARLTTVRVTGLGRAAERAASQAQAALAAAASAASLRAESGRARLDWDASAVPMVIVRDADSGEILSFARGGSARVETSRSELELVFSDGVRSASARVRVR
jgi:hypothetical protein